MSEIVYPCLPELSNSTASFQPQIQKIVVPKMGRLFAAGDSDVKRSVPYLFPWTRLLMVNKREFCILVIPQLSGKFVARTSTNRFSATGQGDTEEDAMQDIEDAIESLMEEEVSPSGDVAWPEDCR